MDSGFSKHILSFKFKFILLYLIQTLIGCILLLRKRSSRPGEAIAPLMRFATTRLALALLWAALARLDLKLHGIICFILVSVIAKCFD